MWLWLGTALAASWVVDGSSLRLNRGRWPVRGSWTCEADEVLGVAVVVYSRKQGTMAWGHSSLRTVTCRDGELVDREYETYRLSAWNEALLRDEHPDLDPRYLARQRGALVLFRNADPVDRGWFAEAEAHNREIYELWLDRPPDELLRIVDGAERWYADQAAVLMGRGELDERYRALSTNCTTVLVRLLGVADPPHMPFAWLRRLEDEARLRVVHPSHALVRRWDGLPDGMDGRVHPLFRRRVELAPSLDVDRDPAVPWTR